MSGFTHKDLVKIYRETAITSITRDSTYRLISYFRDGGRTRPESVNITWILRSRSGIIKVPNKLYEME